MATIADAARLFGVTRQAIQQALKSHRYATETPTRERIAQLAREGKTIRQIADAVGCMPANVRMHLRRLRAATKP